MGAPSRQRVCDHAGHECFGANSKHRMACACGCGKVFELNDPDRLRWAPGWGGNWYAAGHGPGKLDRPEPADGSGRLL